MNDDQRIIFYNKAEQSIKPKISALLAQFHSIKQWPITKTCLAMDKNGSNKNHRQYVLYTPFYDALFADLAPSGILEFGIGSKSPVIPFSMHGQDCKVGGSVFAWHELFPQAKIFAADIDKTVLINDGIISSYFVDALKPETITEMWKNINNDHPAAKIDIIIDDAYHSHVANINLLDASINFLNDNGWYVIEDINRQNKEYVTAIKIWLQKHTYDAVYLDIPNDTNHSCCCLVIIHKN